MRYHESLWQEPSPQKMKKQSSKQFYAI